MLFPQKITIISHHNVGTRYQWQPHHKKVMKLVLGIKHLYSTLRVILNMREKFSMHLNFASIFYHEKSDPRVTFLWAGLGSNMYLYLQIQIQIQIRRICICICIWSNFKPCICICICIWSTVFGVFDKYVFKYTFFLGRFLNTSLWNTNLHEYSLKTC